MTYKTILTHLNHESRARRLLDMAIGLTRAFDAHLVGLHVFPSMRLSPPVPLPFGGEVAAQIRAAIKKEDEQLNALFTETTGSQPFEAEWCSVTSERRDPALTVLDHARSADLVVASQADPNWQLTDMLDFPDRIALGAGCPVLVVPNYGRHVAIPKIVTIAWSQRREAARAVRDALPLLQKAETVNIVSVNEGAETDEAVASERDIVAALARHGVKAKASRVIVSELTVGEEIRVRALDQQADLLVMGCYGHSRLREMALGGVTRHILREMTIPVMLSH